MNGQQLFQFHLSNDKVQISKSVKEHSKDFQHKSQVTSHQTKFMFDCENISSLHAKLYREADKIRKWKIQTELEIQDKEKKLSDATLRLEVMKKSVLEFQLKNQRATSTLQEEVKNKEEVLERVNSTRELCNLLKNHVSKLEEKFNHFADAKRELLNIEEENKKNYESLNGKFQSLQMNAQDIRKKLEVQVNEIKQENDLREQEISRKLNTSELERQRLKDQIDVADNKIHQLKTLLALKDCKLQDLMASIDTLQEKVTNLSHQLENKEDELKKSSERTYKIQEEKSNLENSIKTLEKDLYVLQASNEKLSTEMNQSKYSFEKHIKKLHEDLQVNIETLVDKQKQLEIYEQKLLESSVMVESLKKTNDTLSLEKINSEMQLEMQDFQLNNLKAMCADEKAEIHTLNGEIIVLNSKLDRENLTRIKTQDELDLMQLRISELLLERDEHHEKIIQLNEELKFSEDKSLSLERALHEKENKITAFEIGTEILEQKIADQSLQIKNLQEDLLTYKNKVHVAEEDLGDKAQSVKELRNSIEELMSSNLTQDKEIKAYALRLETLKYKESEQLNEIQNLTTIVSEFMYKISENEQSVAAQQSTLSTFLKKNTELEKKIKNILSQLETKRKANADLEKKIHSLQQELKIILEKKETADKLNSKYKHEQEAAILALKKAEEKLDIAQKDKENAIAKTERQLTAMMATLDDYRQNNQNIIIDKDKEIQTLRMKLQNAELLALEREKALTEWKQEIEKKNETKVKKKADESQVLFDDFKHNSEAVKLNLTKIKTSFTSEDPESQLKESLKTPKMHSISNTDHQKTPQRGILRFSNPISKRRKVAFTPKDSSLSDDSDVVELDTQALNPLKTPMRQKSLWKEEPLKTPDQLLRAPSQASSKRVFKSLDLPCTTKESVQSLLSASAIPSNQGKLTENEVLDEAKINVRKTPLRKTSKFFTTSPKNKAAVSKINKNVRPKQRSTIKRRRYKQNKK
ncbi:hypothetical protein Btru_001031 [Bulinus truncatus]|nr:hypothetical protein Btru_001031 [Bulinus truncatus]